MSTLRVAVQDYLEMRRSLGFKLHDAGIGLMKFISFLERQNASHITLALALQWTQEVLPYNLGTDRTRRQQDCSQRSRSGQNYGPRTKSVCQTANHKC